jgi:glyoxylase-like metal-dependent hydrolase (beta-lactamase superfamily II)
MCDTARANEWHHPGSNQPEGAAIHEQIRNFGYEPKDIEAIILTHLHWDHCFHIGKFKNARIIAAEKEYEFAQNPVSVYYRGYEKDIHGKIVPPFNGVKIDTIKVEGETEIFPGITVFETPGHTPGHISAAVQAQSGEYIIAGDAVLCLNNLKPIPDTQYNVTPPARFCDIVDTVATLEKVQQRMQDPAHVLTCHDVAMLTQITQTPILT